MATIETPKVSVRTNDEQFSVEPVVLADVELTFTIEEQFFSLPCSVIERMAPEPEVTLEYSGDPRVAMEQEAMHALVNSDGSEISASIKSDETKSGAVLFAAINPSFGITPRSNKARFYVSRDLTHQKSPRLMQEASFCIINMHIISIIGHTVASESEFKQTGGIVLRHGEWTIQIRETPQIDEATRFLKAVGGFRITHIVSMHKDDGTDFSIEDAKSKIDAVRLSLSFANGSYVGTCRARGMNALCQTVWEDWDCYPAAWSNGLRPDSWLRKNSRLNLDANQALRDVFPTLINHIESDDSIRKSIERYLVANTTKPFIDVPSARPIGEIAAANLYPMSTNPWRELAVDLKKAGVGLDIPAECPNLQKLYDNNPEWAKKRNKEPHNEPGPFALRELRRHFEHPKSKIKGLMDDYAGHALYEAWHLGQWYLETIILYKCRYIEERANRARGGRWGPLTP